MKNYRKNYILFLLICIFVCFGNVQASIDLNKTYCLNNERYQLCQNDSDTDNQSDIYQEPSQEGDENSPAEIIKQPDENQDSSETN